MLQISPVVKNLIIINVIVYFTVAYLFPSYSNYFEAYYPMSSQFKPIQLVSHMFMHGNPIPHLFFNMFMLYMFGVTMEYYWGSKFFLLTYLLSGFGAIFFHYLVKFIYIYYYSNLISPDDLNMIYTQGREILMSGKNFEGIAGKINFMVNVPAVGASGAVFGILTGFATQFPRRKLMLLFPPIPIDARYLIPGTIILELFLGLGGRDSAGGDGIAHFAHVGGALTGFLLTRFRYKFNM